MAKKVVSIYPTTEQLKRLDKLSARTKVSRSKLIREGVDLLLKRYEKQLKRQTKRR